MRRSLAALTVGLTLAAGPPAGAQDPVYQPTNCVNATGSDGCVREPLQDFSTTAVASPDGKQVYSLSSAGDGAIVQYDRNAASGALTPHEGPKGCITRLGSGGRCSAAGGLIGPIGM